MRPNVRLMDGDFFPSPGSQVAISREAVQAEIASHRHEFWEIVFILSGGGMHVTGETRHELRVGDVLVINNRRSHGYEDTRGLGLVNVLLRSDALFEAERELGRLPGFHVLFTLEPARWRRRDFTARMRLKPVDLRRAEEWIDQIEAETRRSAEGGNFLAKNWLMLLLGFLARKHAERPAEDGDWRLARLLSRIDSEPAADFSIASMARAAGMSERSFQRRFREAAGHSPLDYVIRSRVRQARAMLEAPDSRLSITEIAFRCGFNDSNYFTRQFRRVTGGPPRRHRRLE
jgi:AraC-like DNA-binding protein